MSCRLLSVMSAMSMAALAQGSTLSHVYLGTNGAGPGTGIARATFDAASGTLTKPELVAVTSDPAFLLLHPDGRHLYAANTGTPGGVSAFAIDPATGDLTPLNGRPSPARGPSHLGIDRTGHFIFDANYGDGHVRVHALEADGSLGTETAFIQHRGHGFHPTRQDRPHAHYINVEPANRFALVADLGLDEILVYRFDAASGGLAPHDTPFTKTAPGAGPRHLAWHPNGTWIYAVNELANTVTFYTWNAASGTLHDQQTEPTLPADFTGANTSAEIAVHPNGRWLYSSNRGHDSIAIFAIDGTTGRLTPHGHVSSRGKTPRYFVIDPSGRWMLVTNHDSDTITIFAVDPASGALPPHGEPVAWAKPFGIVFLPQSQPIPRQD